jgi:hypothetical protein
MTNRTSTFQWMTAIGLLLALPAAHAQQEMRFDQKYVESIKKDSTIAPVNVDSFGDNTDLENGGVTFRWTDIDIPGNNSLPVRLQRTLVVEDKLFSPVPLGGFGAVGGNAAEDIDIPYLKGIFSTNGWQVATSNPNARCTSYTNPPNDNPVISYDDYWNGNWMHIPWAGDQAMLGGPAASLPKPDGGTTAMTKNFWSFKCLASTKNGYPGEGFIAISPDGEKYYFDWVVTKDAGWLTKRYGNYGAEPGDSGPMGVSSITPDGIDPDGTTPDTVSPDIVVPSAEASINRSAVYFLVTRIEDRFGNWVTYNYSGDKLGNITASDGRYIQINWNGNNIASVSSSIGTWTYAYTSTSMTTTQPDGSHWSYVSTGDLRVNPTPSLPLYVNDNNPPRCPAPEPSFGDYQLAVTQPSGATATYVFTVMRHGKSNVPKMCNSFIDGSMMTYQYLTIPNFNDTLTLVSKTVTGPGVPAAQWSYNYLSAGAGLAFEDVCSSPSAACPKTKTTEVRGPNGEYKRYVFGKMYKVNSGQLLEVDEGYETGAAPNAQDVILKTTMNDYVQASDLPSLPFPDEVGTPGSQRFDDIEMASLRPIKQTVTTQDGRTFTHAVNTFDVFARPTKVTSSSAPSP